MRGQFQRQRAIRKGGLFLFPTISPNISIENTSAMIKKLSKDEMPAILAAELADGKGWMFRRTG
jgi:hypothetical protein